MESAIGKSRDVVIYFVLAYGFSTLLWLPLLVGKNRSFPVLALGTFGPTLAMLATQRIVTGSWKTVRWWTSLPKFILGLFAAGSLFLCADFLTALLVTRSGFDRWQWGALAGIITMFPIDLLGGPLGEEAGWRGFAFSRIQQKVSPALSATIVGFFWALWHFPLLLAHIYTTSWWQFLLLIISGSILISFGFNISEGNTTCAIFLHCLYNLGIGVIGNEFIGKAELRSQTFQMHALWMVYVGVALLLCLLTRGQLGRRPRRALVS